MAKKLSEINNAVIALTSDSTIHGLPRVFKSKLTIVKLIWLACFVCSGCICAYASLKTIQSYFDYQVITNIQTFKEKPAMFPAITLCNLNQFNRNKSIDQINFYSFKNLKNFEKNYFLINDYFNYNDTVKQSIGYDLNETLIKCTINSNNCDSSEFEWIFLPFSNGGNCFRFNSGKNSKGQSIDLKRITQSGSSNGFRLELFLGNPNTIAPFIENSGYHVNVNNQTAHIKISEGYDIAAGMETNIILNRYYNSLKPYPYSECRDGEFDSDLYRALTKLNKTYSQSDCHDLCYQKFLIQECQCHSNSLDNLGSTVYCASESQQVCSLRVWTQFLASNVNEKCSQYCPLECDSMGYQLTITTSLYPTKRYAESELMTNPTIKSKFLNETLTYDLIKQSVLSLNIYYDQLEYTASSQDAKTELYDLVSNLGGLFGLFLGVSFLSIIEIFEILIEIISILISKAKTSP